MGYSDSESESSEKECYFSGSDEEYSPEAEKAYELVLIKLHFINDFMLEFFGWARWLSRVLHYNKLFA